MITKSPWGVLGFSVAWGRGDGFNPVETCLAASWICSQMCCHDEKNFTRFLIQCFIQFHFFFSLNINNDSVLISMVLYGCLKRLSTYSIIAIHSFQHVFFAQFFCQMHLHVGAQPGCRGTGHTPECSATGHWRARGSLCCDQLEEGRLKKIPSAHLRANVTSIVSGLLRENHGKI